MEHKIFETFEIYSKFTTLSPGSDNPWQIPLFRTKISLKPAGKEKSDFQPNVFTLLLWYLFSFRFQIIYV